MTIEFNNLTQLDSVLEQERAFLLEGDLEGLGTLLPLKEELVALFLTDTDAHREEIAPLKGKLQRNQLLLDGALDGIRAVAARLAALRQVRNALDTYDAHGRKQHVDVSASPKVEKRA